MDAYDPGWAVTLTGNWHNRVAKNPTPSMADALAEHHTVSFSAKPGGGRLGCVDRQKKNADL